MKLQSIKFMEAYRASKASQARSRRGFTLVEMLVVLSIISVLSILVSAGFQSILGSVLDGQVSDLASTLTRARAYAMANNTYVFVGIQEVSASNPSSGTQAAGTGRIGVTVVASNDGTRIYASSAPSALTASSLTVVSPLRHYDNLHITTPPTSGSLSSSDPTLPNATANATTYNLALPSSTSGLTYESTSTSLTTFQWPLSGTAQYSFGANSLSPGTVIQFNPQGQAQIVTSPYTDSILQWIEIDLIPTHGTTVSASNPATILIDGASGSVTTYRE
jgi:prepilin-type N-terminal cleavage/methylation domain-containing protein